MKPNSNPNRFQQLFFILYPRFLINITFFGLTQNGRQNRSAASANETVSFFIVIPKNSILIKLTTMVHLIFRSVAPL